MTDPTAPRRTGRAARLLSGVLVLGLTGGVVGLAVAAPPHETDPVPAASVDVAPAATTLVCPGPLQLPDDSLSGDSAFDRVPVAPVERVTGFGTGDSTTASLTVLGEAPVPLVDGSASVASPGAATVLRADPVDGAPARVAGATSSVVTDGDLRGLSAASCARPSADVWLVGGSTELESTADLVVVNPGATPADVTVEAWGPSGPVDLANGGTFLVAPGAERVLSLPGVAAEQRRIAVRVTAAGGQVSAYLQDSLLDGFTPRGTDLVTAGTGPATTQVVPGISVVATEVDAADAGALRVLVPGTEDATVSVRLLGPDGDVELPGAQELDLPAGEVTDVSLGGLAAGSYTAVVESTEAVVAGAMIAREGRAGELDEGPRLERAWIAATAPGGGLVAVPSGAAGAVTLTAVPTGDGSTEPAPATASSAAPSPEPTEGQRPDPEVDSAPSGPTITVTLRAYGAEGLLEEHDVAVPVGSTTGYRFRELGDRVVGIEVVVPESDDADVTWALSASAQAGGPLISVLQPVTDDEAVTRARVREGSRVGLD